MEYATANVHDLIVSDITMPEMDGISMVQHIRVGQGPNRVTPVVILTGHHEEGERAAGKLGARFVAKPCRRKVLLEAASPWSGPS